MGYLCGIHTFVRRRKDQGAELRGKRAPKGTQAFYSVKKAGRRTPCGGSGTGHDWIAEAELLKLEKRGQFPGELVKIKVAQIHYVASQM